jgi:hypothetical protein
MECGEDQISRQTRDRSRRDGAVGRSGPGATGVARLPRLALLAALVVAASVLAACGSSGSTSGEDTLVRPPPIQLQGCTYAPTGSIPSGEVTGVMPKYASFSPDAAATSALTSIEEHGGTALTDSFTLAGGVPLFAGPDATRPRVGTVPQNYAVTVGNPVVWKGSAGDQWIAFFLACGGPNLYWTSVDEIASADPQNAPVSDQIRTSIRQAAPGHPIQLAGIGINRAKNFYWTHPKLSSNIALGLQFGPVA